MSGICDPLGEFPREVQRQKLVVVVIGVRKDPIAPVTLWNVSTPSVSVSNRVAVEHHREPEDVACDVVGHRLERCGVAEPAALEAAVRVGLERLGHRPGECRRSEAVMSTRFGVGQASRFASGWNGSRMENRRASAAESSAMMAWHSSIALHSSDRSA